MRHITQDPNIDPKQLRQTLGMFVIFFIMFTLYFLFWTIKYSINDAATMLGLSFLATAPAYLADLFMPIAGTIKWIPRKLMDGGRMYRGNRLFGDHKTWNGFIGGIVLGFIAFYLITFKIYPAVYDITVSYFASGNLVFKYVTEEQILFFVDTSNPFWFYFGQFLMCVGAPVGDLLASFIKRRFNRPPGTQFPVLDQIDFIVMGILFAYPVFPIPLEYALFPILLSPMITILANILGYYTGRKEVPW
jgi:CDP-2,3-bis-(O-geranylgeranyl)-sn-glycerol synthase